MTDDINIRFCKIVLRQTMADLTQNEVRDFRANAGCLRVAASRRSGNADYLVEWPKMDKDGSTFAWEGHADNAYDAKAKAINDWLEYHAPTVRARKLVEGWESGTSGRDS